MTLPLDQPCACGGRNPTCALCNGWGFVKAERTLRTLGALSEFLMKDCVASKRCPLCKAVIKPENLSRHLQKVHWDWLEA